MNINKTEALKRLSNLEKESAELRKIIEQPEELIGRIVTYEQVCEELGEDELTLDDFDHLPHHMGKKLLAIAKIQQIGKLFNEGWTPNWDNSNEYKYYPWFQYKASGGWSFSYGHFVCSGSCAVAYYYKSSKVAEYVGKTFIDIYKQAI